MNELVKEWVLKAEGDYNTALRENRARKMPNFDAAGFHAQQCIEKYLKAVLQFYNVPFQKIHDLLTLKELCKPFAPELELYHDLLAYLNQFGVTYRYPGEFASREQAKKAIRAMKILRRILRAKIGLVN